MRWDMALAAGFLAVLFSVMMAFQRSLYSAAICLLAVMMQVALLFSLSGSPFLGLMQMMIYAGAVMVLVVVVIMAFPQITASRWGNFFLPKSLAVLLLVGFLLELLLSLHSPQDSALVASVSAGYSSVGSILFGPYAPATEAATLLMFLAGLALVGKRPEHNVAPKNAPARFLFASEEGRKEN